MNKKKKIAAVVAAAVVVAAGAAVLLRGLGGGQGVQGGPGSQSGPGGAGGIAENSNVTIVKAGTPYTGDVSITTYLTGTVEPSEVVYVYAKAAGDVTAVNVTAGDMVTQGQVLCEINTEQVDSARNAMESAQVSLGQAQSNLSRMQILYGGGDLSDQEYEQYVNSLKSAQLQYESAKMAYEKQVEYSTVTAPINGKIESCDVEVFDHVGQSAQLCVISGEGENQVSFYVSQRMMQNLQNGDAMEIQKNGKTYAAYITEISSMVDSATGLFKVKASLEATDEIAAGSTVKLGLVTEKTENAMLVPVNAIYYSGGDGYVYLYQDGTAQMVPVEVGLYDSDNAQILSGLSWSDVVVSTWSSNLYQGAKLRLWEGSGGAGESDTGEGSPAEAGEQNAGSQETTHPEQTEQEA